MLSFGSQGMKKAPWGSWTTAMRPTSITSKGGATTFAPSSLALSAVASALSTLM